MRSHRIFERLRDEHEFSDGCTIAKDYVRARRQSTREAFVPLHYSPGHVQVDFGEAMVEVGGAPVRNRGHGPCAVPGPTGGNGDDRPRTPLGRAPHHAGQVPHRQAARALRLQGNPEGRAREGWLRQQAPAATAQGSRETWAVRGVVPRKEVSLPQVTSVPVGNLQRGISRAAGRN